MHSHSHSSKKADATPKRGALLFLWILFVLVLHCVVTFVLYRGRVVDQWWFTKLDIVVFHAPLVLVFFLYAILFTTWNSLRKMHLVARLAIGVILGAITAVLSKILSLFIAFNVYRT
jgi:hypothetical protein